MLGPLVPALPLTVLLLGGLVVGCVLLIPARGLRRTAVRS